MRTPNKWATAAAALGLLMEPGCDKDDSAATDPLLVVKVAEEQAGTDGLGIIVVIQSWGGAWLEVEVSGGTLPGGKQAVCLPAPAAPLLRDSRQDILVFPELVESVVTVRLMPDKAPVPDGVAGAEEPRGPSALGPCRIDARELQQVIKPIRRAQPAPSPSGGSGGVAGFGGAGGSGGSGDRPVGGSGGGAGTGGQPEGGAGSGPTGGSTDGGGPIGGAGAGGVE